MKHISVKMDTPCEFLNIVSVNPLISKCQIKVCYVGDQPNRNKSIITKKVATQMANSLPGSPIVGFYDEEEQDFQTHSKEIVIRDNKITFNEKTRPYGFVDLNAKVWFQKFLDDGVEREYLMTEGYLWTGQYPECQRVIDEGNNHSMELDKKNIDAYWTKDVNGKPQFFIINEAIFSKLCILGEDWEPCFEGSTISKVEFSFDEGFESELKGMIYQLQELVEKGGNQTMPKAEDLEFENKKKEEEEKNNQAEDEKGKEDKEKIEDNTEDKSKEKEEEEDKKKKINYSKDEVCPKCGKPVSECTCKSDYSLDEIPEYVQLKTDYENLQTKYSEIESKISELEEENKELTEFKAQTERKDKEEMIKSFYMLSDEDKKDVIDNIDEYSLNDIEAKLSILCVRNKVNFNLEENEEKEEEDPLSYNLNDGISSSIPAWAQAVMAQQK